MSDPMRRIQHPVSQLEYPSILCGALAPLFTPERLDGRIDFAGIEAMTDYLCGKNSVSAILVRTQEGSMWSYSGEELCDAIGCVLDAAQGRKPVLACTAGIWDGDQNNAPRPAAYFKRCVELSQWAISEGAAAVLQPVPTFFQGGSGFTPQERVFRFFEDLARVGAGPMLIYHQAAVPATQTLSPELIGRLSHLEPYLGTIYCTADSSRIMEIVRACEPRFSVLSGFDSVAIPAFMGGATSTAGALAALLPELVHAAWRSLAEPDLPFAWRAQNDLLKLRQLLSPYAAAQIGCAMMAMQGVSTASRARSSELPVSKEAVRYAHRELSLLRPAYM